MAKGHLVGVEKCFGPLRVIQGVDLEIHDGELLVFVGPSGCGKSTLLRMIAGLEEIDGGLFMLDGAPMNEVPSARRGIAMVFQSYALYPHMTVRQNLSFGLETMGAPRPKIQQAVDRASRILHIEHLLERRPRQLSGGQRQRVAIGRAIVREPRLFLFDEPLSNLDAELRNEMRVEIIKLQKSLGTTMIYVTHDQVEAMTMADRIAVLRDGRLEQVGSPIELYERPLNRFVAGFIGAPRMNFLEATVRSASDAHIQVDLTNVPTSVSLPSAPRYPAVGSRVTLGIRPGDVRIGNATQTGIPIEVVLVEQLGGSSLIHASLPGGGEIVVQEPGHNLLRGGARMHAVLPPEHCYLFGEDGSATGRRTQPVPPGAVMELMGH
jgi:multiple sugar transport system ATP-binding protein